LICAALIWFTLKEPEKEVAAVAVGSEPNAPAKVGTGEALRNYAAAAGEALKIRNIWVWAGMTLQQSTFCTSPSTTTSMLSGRTATSAPPNSGLIHWIMPL